MSNISNLSDLKKLHISELIKLAESCSVENSSRMRRQDLIFGILKSKAKNGEVIKGQGSLEVLPDGFGFFKIC